MSVSRTVVALADLIEQRLPPESARERLQLQILRMMPLYLELGDLVAWEEAFTSVMAKDSAAVGSAAWALEHVFDFGRGNMYAAFQEEVALIDYAFMQAELLKGGVEVPSPVALNEW